MAATKVEKAYCVLELAKTNSVTVVTLFLYKMELRLTGTYGPENIWMRRWIGLTGTYGPENIWMRRWIGRASEENVVLKPWAPRSPDLTPCDYFFWGYVNGKVFISPLVDIEHELK
ncbi:hypothetical protein QE152_g17090 [Popillia japonica]|uniref:Uncharacterized protein n=1 Tax=Popillia japonica TaxID=7064 RepID=A0AAW1L482_POPJA